MPSECYLFSFPHSLKKKIISETCRILVSHLTCNPGDAFSKILGPTALIYFLSVLYILFIGCGFLVLCHSLVIGRRILNT